MNILRYPAAAVLALATMGANAQMLNIPVGGVGMQDDWKCMKILDEATYVATGNTRAEARGKLREAGFAPRFDCIRASEDDLDQLEASFDPADDGLMTPPDNIPPDNTPPPDGNGGNGGSNGGETAADGNPGNAREVGSAGEEPNDQGSWNSPPGGSGTVGQSDS